MPKFTGQSYSVDIEWSPDGEPVLYVTGHGRVNVTQAIELIQKAVDITNEASFKHVCGVYNMFDAQLPFLGRFIVSGAVPTTPRTAHIIIGSHSKTLQLAAAMIAVASNKRLRTMEACTTPEQIAEAVKRWLALPDRSREYTIDDV